METYLEVFLHSIAKQCRYVREVIVVKTDEPSDQLVHAWKEGSIDVRLYGCVLFPETPPFSPKFQSMVCGHALGMHRALDIAKGKYVWMCDPDTFLLTELDRFYLDLLEGHNLRIVGVSHFNPSDQSYLYFPCAINCMLLRENLPDASWLKDELFVQSGMRAQENCAKLHEVRGKYLIPGPLKRHYAKFPNPSGIFDMGCNLWLWNHESGGKWIGFHLDTYSDSFRNNGGTKEIVYPMNYSAERYQSNFGLRDDLGDFDLLYHRTRGSKEDGQAFRTLYESLLR